MITPGEGYRLLNVGEQIQEGDEYYSPTGGKWSVSVCDGTTVDLYSFKYRRKLPAAQVGGWVMVRDRVPSERMRVLAINHADGKAHCTTWNGEAFALNPNPYAWMPIPPPPAPPKSEAEIAWERYEESRPAYEFVKDAIKAAFIAGFNAEAAK